ncbi:MAG: LysR family transcriptional regulator, partial [Methyloversatilis discipulorum]|nr:LysR family transcriptional regulator [Methyloversatilis discipulorum]
MAAALAMMGMPVAQGAEEAAKEGGNWAGTDDFSFQLSGYARAWASFNLEDQPELSAVGKDSAGKLSMLRGSVLLDADAKTGPVKWKVIGRLDREYKTNYLEDLEDLRVANGTAGGKSITENYNNGDIREFWAEIPIGDRITVKAGKQQLVWGESDFFQAMDLVHGYDYSWRLFFEGENEEWRKPLIMVSTKIRIPEAKGMIAAFVRPGWDRCEDIGNTYDIRGGRWFFQP